MGRAPCCSRVGLHKGPWTPNEDSLLIQYIQSHGEGHWRSLPLNAGLLRCGKSCRLRWMNYLRPDIKRGNITPDEEDLIIELHGLLGNRWSLIAKRLAGRTDNEIKNYWNTHLNKRLHNQETIEIEKSSNGKKRSRINMNNHSNSNKSKTPNPDSLVDDKLEVLKEIKDENTINIGEERDKPKIHLPIPVRVSPVMMSPLTRNNNNGSLIEANYNYVSTNSSGSSTSISQRQSQHPNDDHHELPFDSSSQINGLTDMSWLSSNANTMGDDHHMMMMRSSSCGDNDVNIVDHIIHHHHDHHYGVAPQDCNIQPFENLYEEYLQLIKVDDYHGIDDVRDDHDDEEDVDSFTRSFLI